MSETIQEPLTDSSNLPVFLNFPWKRRLYGAFMVIMTFLDFRFVEFLKPDWQSGQLQDYITLLVSPEASLFFFPLILYSLICFLFLMENQKQYAGKFIVRLGIYTGVFLALQYSLLTILILNDSPSFSILLLTLLYISPLLLQKLHQWLSGKLSAVLIRNLAIAIIFVLILIYLIVTGAPLSGVLIFLGFVAPFWSFLIAGETALWLFRNYESKITIARAAGIVAWLAAYLGALRYDILKMYELYAALPPTPPDCYIATAAANGHPRLVHSRTVRLKSGHLMRVNSQLQHFKALEITLMAAFPKIHHFVRKIYDVIGRRLALYIQNPLLADVAFLLLLPLEWLSFHLLKLLVPKIEEFAQKIYHS